MPYQAGQRLSGESASKLGHLDVLNSEFVNQVVEQFEHPDASSITSPDIDWFEVDKFARPLKYIFASDGSLQHLASSGNPKREVSFVKTALMRIDPTKIEQIDPDYPHPNQLRKLMSESAQHHATVFPVKNIRIHGTDWLYGMRKLIYDSFRDPQLDGEPYKTLKWVVYQKWEEGTKSNSPAFECPECYAELPGMKYDTDQIECPECQSVIFLTDIIGLHMEMSEDSASETLASAYMMIHETMMLFTAIRYLWQKNHHVLKETLFLKDGPLTLRGQYSKLVPNLRNFISKAKSIGVTIHLCGQEKTGKFVDFFKGYAHLVEPLEKGAPSRFSPLTHKFIHSEVQRKRDPKYPYGFRTNYGEKVLLKQSPHHLFVLNIPTGQYLDNENKPNRREDLIGVDRIMATIPKILSYRHESALVPIELVNGIASLSNYPSATVLKLFSGLE
ncbi:hypothetical protein B4O97_01705 [Marispirochaeta aestuarii]|uniref:NurA domain-containing protein n=1 Tax=Marispirochaeta aestuarii TaxID=1963862 RepID=A0A1Y1S2Z5_9SPIO|nr:hypothetical protein [Marispirochaeta aestuarii]ORC37742.1 hypothetical protein B4O97_01705 [Marispirochaeta aestuarii]